jgi:hypothetical protein
MKKILLAYAILLAAGIGCSVPTGPQLTDPTVAKVKITLGMFHYVTYEVLPIKPSGEKWIGSDTTVILKKGIQIQVAWKELEEDSLTWRTATGCLFRVENDTILKTFGSK